MPPPEQTRDAPAPESLQLLISFIPCPAAVFGANGVLGFANGIFTQLSGAMSGEILPGDLLSAVANGLAWSGLLPLGNGSQAHRCPFTAIPWKNDAGRVTHFVLVADMKARQEELHAAARTDPLTGALNRRGLEADLDALWARAAQRGEPVGLLMADLDHFKDINDRHGHAAGDEVLREAARRIRGLLRASDLLCRHGGDEFLIVLPATPPAGMREVADRLLRAFRSREIVAGAFRLTVTLSIGGAGATVSPRLPPAALVAQADRAMLLAKQEGRDRACFAGPG